MDMVLSKGGPYGKAAWWRGLSSTKSTAAAEYRSPPRPAIGEVHHVELFVSSREASGAGLALAFALDRNAADERPWLWVQDARALKLGGRPYQPGLPPSLRHRLIHVAAQSSEDALFTLEEGLRCRDLAFVMGEIAGNPKALSFTAARRLSLAVERHGTPLWLVRLDAARELSSARQRWMVRAAPSLPPRWNIAAPGAPAWYAELFRARAHPPGVWVLRESDRQLVQDTLPERGEDTQAWLRSGLAEVGEGHPPMPRGPSAPLQAPLATEAASCAILSPSGERASA